MIRRGQIWWVDFAEPRGSEPGFRHPALVLQRDEVNASCAACRHTMQLSLDNSQATSSTSPFPPPWEAVDLL